MKKLRTFLYGLSGVALTLGLGTALPANATVTQGDASAYAVQGDILGSPVIGPLPYSSVSGSGSDSDSILDVSAGPLHVGALNSSAFSNVDGSPGPKEASSSASILDVDFALNHLMGLSFDVISSNSSVTGDAGSFSATGNSSIVNLTGFGLLSGLNGITITGAPNQTLLNLAGIEVIANRQTSACSSFDCAITTDALYVDVLGQANVTLASSTAHLAAPVPEPTTMAMMMVGIAGLGSRLRKKKAAATV
ncbi:MAG TPA: PEP-CTERM sorting domain-containing protein [Methylophilaceae bacterium]|nr:PEP-CTERM sorting domain-containing protein [Methylophilaceae bacterium]